MKAAPTRGFLNTSANGIGMAGPATLFGFCGGRIELLFPWPDQVSIRLGLGRARVHADRAAGSTATARCREDRETSRPAHQLRQNQACREMQGRSYKGRRTSRGRTYAPPRWTVIPLVPELVVIPQSSTLLGQMQTRVSGSPRPHFVCRLVSRSRRSIPELHARPHCRLQTVRVSAPLPGIDSSIVQFSPSMCRAISRTPPFGSLCVNSSIALMRMLGSMP